ncbi:MAG: preprotein translocase subunit YajC [Ruminococcaceae bacterium]|nr:preprotein translocase subunit YajC [Oscillospiraceae bacterium]
MDQTTAGGASSLLSLIPMLLIWGAIFYFLLIRPQKKKDKQFKDMLSALEVGDKIVTIGGFYGKVTKIKDDKIDFECGQGENQAVMHIYKWGIKEVLKKEKA